MTQVELCIVGCGGHARSIADVALDNGIRTLVFVDANAREGEAIYGFPVMTPDRFAMGGVKPRHHIVGLGDNRQREASFLAFRGSAEGAFAVVARDARIGREAVLGTGVFVGMATHIGPSARIGDDVIVNTRAIVEHEVVVGAHTHIAVNAILLGRSRIGDRSTLGAGAIVVDGIAICDDVVVGAGAVVIRDIDEPGTYVGVPARRLRD